MSLRAGVSVLVRFPEDDDPSLWQERWLLGHVSGSIWVAATPDLEVESIDLGPLQIRVMNSRRDLPVGLKEEDCYLFYDEDTPDGFLSRADQRRFLEEGATLAAVDRGRASDAAGSSRDPAPAPPRLRLEGKQAIEDRRALATRADEWEAAEATPSAAVGSVVPPPAPAQRIGDRGLSQLSDGSVVFARRRGSSIAVAPAFGLPAPPPRRRS